MLITMFDTNTFPDSIFAYVMYCNNATKQLNYLFLFNIKIDVLTYVFTIHYIDYYEMRSDYQVCRW